MKHVSCTAAAALLLAATATALGQAPVVDGTRDASYGAALYVNTANPTGFGDNVPGNFECSSFGSGMQLAINNSNILGVPAGPGACVASGAGITTGIEIKIPFSAINNPTDATIRIAGFVIAQDHSFLSNQVIGGSTTCLAANLGDPRATSFDDADAGGIAGDQFVTVANGADTDPAGPVIDGTLDAGFWTTPALWVSTTETLFGDNNLGLPSGCNGNEIDAIYARVVTVGGEKSLYVFLTGNLASDFSKIWLFFDTAAGQGQNRLLGNNPNLDFNGLNRLGEFPVGTGGNGLKFDAGFDCDYALTCTNGNNPVNTFANIGETTTTGGGQGRFVGQAVNPAPIVVSPCVPTPLPVPSPDKAYGSEIDAIYAKACGNYLHVFIAGNLEVNGNKLDIFFDVDGAAGGQQTLRADNVGVGFNGLNRMGAGNGGPGLTFDSGFTADYWVTYRNEGAGVNDAAYHGSEAAFLRATGAQGDAVSAQGLLDYGSFTAGPKASTNPLVYDGTFCVRDNAGTCQPNGFGGPFNPSSVVGIDVQGDLLGAFNTLTVLPEVFSSFAPRLISPLINFCIDPPDCTSPDLAVAGSLDPLGTANGRPNLTIPGLVSMTIDNNNIAGVTDTTATGGELVTTGYELRIRLDELGWDGTSPIKICAFVNGGGHDFLSNQVSGGLPAGTVNLGDPQAVNFDDTTGGIAGNQFVSVTYTTSCDPVVTTGACCCGSNCSVTTSEACTGVNLAYAGNGTACTPFSTTVPCCRGNFNKSAPGPGAPGGVSVQDIFDFLSAYFSSDPCANANDSTPGPGAPNGVSVQDIFDFLSAYFGGC
ncbi:MAG: hypothetical protein IT438_03565 [Phycisphaerales bacterium]|nr:hypothetical protein [Phycisphaerales bacterium]